MSNSQEQFVIPSASLTMDALSDLDTNKRSLSSIVITTGAVAASAGGAYLSLKYGSDIDMAQITPNVPVVSQIPQGINKLSDVLTATSLPIMTGALAAEAGIAYSARKNPRIKSITTAAKVDYAGTEAAGGSKVRRRIGNAIAGTGLAAVVLVTAAAGINREVSDGPSRAIDKTIETLSPNNNNPYMVVQDETQQFMNNSYVSRQKANRLVALSVERGITAVPFNRELGDIRNGDNITNMTLGVPKPVFTEIHKNSGSSVELPAEYDCNNVPVIIDGDTRIDVGQNIYVHNQSAEVVATVSGASSMNRMAVIEDEKDVAKCIQHNEDSDYYGIVVDAPKIEAEQLFKDAGYKNEAHLIDADQFRDYNKRFWQSNGAPILLQLMGYIGGFAFIANRNERRASMQRNIKEISTLYAGGVTHKKLVQIESLRALRETTLVTLPAAVLAPAFAAGVNAAEWGIKVGIGAREVAVGFAITLAAKLFGARRAVKKMSTDINEEVARG